jgi:hypothetical protein
MDENLIRFFRSGFEEIDCINSQELAHLYSILRNTDSRLSLLYKTLRPMWADELGRVRRGISWRYPEYYDQDYSCY